MRAEDLGEVREILEDGILSPKTGGPLAGDIDEHLASVSESLRGETTRRYLVAALPDGRVVGVAGLASEHIAGELFTRDERPVEVVAYVRRSHRGLGAGHSLRLEIEATAAQMGFTTLLVVTGSRNRDRGYASWPRRYGSPLQWDEDYFGPGHERVVWRWPLT